MENTIEAAYGEFNAKLKRYAMKLVKNEDAAEDVVQEAWMLAIRRWDTLEDQSRRLSWLIRIARNIVYTEWRNKAARVIGNFNDAPLDSEEVSGLGVSYGGMIDAALDVWKFIPKLSEQDRTTVLSRMEGHMFETHALKVRYCRAKGRLLKHMTKKPKRRRMAA